MFLGLVPVVAADRLQIDQIDLDGTAYELPEGGSITVRGFVGRFRIALSGPVEDGVRLRYRLEGVDQAWQDPPNSMRILLNFLGEQREVVGSCDFLMRGETPGWRQKVETSDFIERHDTTVVPPLSRWVSIAILSHGEDDGVGILGLDRLRFTVKPLSGGKPQSIPLDTTSGKFMDQHQGSPLSWYRGYGSRAEIAEVRIRAKLVPHPILVLNDSDPIRYGNWALLNKALSVSPGDTVGMDWEVAHSIGRSGSHAAEYTRLLPGKYVFRAMLCTIDGTPTGQELAIPLSITAPWHQRWYFWVLILGSTAGLGAWVEHIFKRRRMRQRLDEFERQQAMERERERIARDLHDNIGAGLTEIAMLSDWVHADLQAVAALGPASASDAGARVETGARVERIRQSAIELARSVDEIVWAINPANDDLKRFANYLMQATSQFLASTNIRVRYQIPQDLIALPISGKIRHNLFLVVREALNNIVKYAQAGLVRIELEYADRIIRLVVEDDGVGFVASAAGAPGTHEGLLSMEKRMHDIGGVLDLISLPGRGTRIELQVHCRAQSSSRN